jgi:FkbM family methyltransferase
MFRNSPAYTRTITDQDIRFCYTFFLQREPDDTGLAHYRERMAAGATLEELIRGFAASDEFLMKIGSQPQNDVVDVDLGGYLVAVHRLDPDFGNHIFQFREYEEHVRKALRENIGEGGVFVDIGTNVGVMALLAGTIVGPKGRVIAIEPEPANLQMLYRGILINKLTNVEVWPFAASNARNIFSMGGLSNSHLEEAGAVGAYGKLAQSVVLDDLLGDLPRLDCVKIDIEGHEPAATAGFWKNLTKHRPALIVEWNPRTLRRAGEDIRAYGAKLLEIHPTLRVTSAFGDNHAVTSADELVAFWEQRDAEIVAAGKLPPGALHFDLIARG